MGRRDTLATRMVHCAAGYAPAALCERLEGEWLADLSAERGRLTRFRFALGCFWAVVVIRWDADCSGAALATRSATVADTLTACAYRRPARLALRPTAATDPAAMCDINTTPLIDVLLVLLVTLIVSLPVMTHAVKLNLPPAAVSADRRPEAIELEIDFDGTVVWNGTALRSSEQLDDYLHAEARREPQREIHLRPDRRVRYDSVAKVLAAAQRNRMQTIGFVNTAEFNDQL